MAVHKHSPRQHAPRACKRCGTRIPPVARKHGDPFCSRICAEATYGTHIRSTRGRMVLGGLRLDAGLSTRGGAQG